MRDSGAIGSADRLVLGRDAAQRLEDDRPFIAGEPHAVLLRVGSYGIDACTAAIFPSVSFHSAAVFLSRS